MSQDWTRPAATPFPEALRGVDGQLTRGPSCGIYNLLRVLKAFKTNRGGNVRQDVGPFRIRPTSQVNDSGSCSGPTETQAVKGTENSASRQRFLQMAPCSLCPALHPFGVGLLCRHHGLGQLPVLLLPSADSCYLHFYVNPEKISILIHGGMDSASPRAKEK